MDGFTKGFHTGLVALPQFSFECPNLKSAMSAPVKIDDLIKKEFNKGFGIGPFRSSPFKLWRVSPIGLVCGKFSNKFRIIYELSAPLSFYV